MENVLYTSQIHTPLIFIFIYFRYEALKDMMDGAGRTLHSRVTDKVYVHYSSRYAAEM
jgi:hypothetical protein